MMGRKARPKPAPAAELLTDDQALLIRSALEAGLTRDQAALIVGGETCMWGEYVDQDNWFARVWPRAAAVGERLWSQQTNKVDTADALNRLLVFRCRLQARGFDSTPLQPGFCATHYV